MRPRLLELPDAPLLATVAAILVLLYTLYHAFLRSSGGWKAVLPGIVTGVVVAGALIKFVAFGEGFEKAGVPIFAYGFMIMLGFAGVILIATLRGRVFGIDANHIMDLGLFAMLGGIVGARLWHYFQYDLPAGTPGDPYPDLFSIVQIWRGGIVFYGGLIGGFVCCTAYILKHQLNYWVVSEVVGPVIPIGIAFARLGCFLNGCCFGGVCSADSFGAVRFPANPGGDLASQSPAYHHHLTALQDRLNTLLSNPDQSAAATEVRGRIDALIASGHSPWVWPAQLFASAGAMTIFALLMLYSRFVARKPGESFFLLLVLYAPFRYWMETFRDDTPAVWGAMTAGQAAGIPLVLIGIAGVLWVRFGNPPHMEGHTMKGGAVPPGAVSGAQDAPKPGAAPAEGSSAPAPPAPPTDFAPPASE